LNEQKFLKEKERNELVNDGAKKDEVRLKLQEELSRLKKDMDSTTKKFNNNETELSILKTKCAEEVWFWVVFFFLVLGWVAPCGRCPQPVLCED